MILKKQFRDYCESLGIMYRHELGVPGYAPMPAEKLADHLAVRLLQPGQLPDLHEKAARQLLASQAWWAVAIPGSPPLIIYHPCQPAARLQSTIMHELGHVILDHVPEQLVTLTGHFQGRAYPKQQEEEAKYLGSCLQITKTGLDWVRQQAWTIEEAAKHFGASVPMVRYRLNMTGRRL